MHTYAVFAVSFYKSYHLRVNLKVGHVCTELLMPVHGQWESQVVAGWGNSYLYICTYIHTYVHTYIHWLENWFWRTAVGLSGKQGTCVYRRLQLHVELTHLMWLGEGDGAWGRPCEFSACTERYVARTDLAIITPTHAHSLHTQHTYNKTYVHTYVHTFCQVWQGLVHREGVIVILKGLMPCTNLGLHVRMYIRIKVNTQRGQFHSFSIHMCSMYTYV